MDPGVEEREEWSKGPAWRPLLSAAAALILGAISGARAVSGTEFWAVVSCVAGLVLWLDIGWRRRPVVRCLVAIVLFAVSFASVRSTLREAERVAAATRPGWQEVTGRIVALEKVGRGRRRGVLEVERAGSVELEGRVGLILFGFDARLVEGARIRGRGRLALPVGPRNPGEIDQAALLRRRGLGGTLFLNCKDIWAVTGAPSRLAEIREGVRSWVRVSFHRHLPPASACLERALLLGERRALSDEIQRSFFLSGNGHYLALSGLHIAVLGLTVFGGMRGIFGGGMWSVAGTISFLASYVFVVGAMSSVVRACLMLATCLLARLISTKPDSLNGLGGAATAILIVAPEQALELGFQLSFVAVAGILLLYRPFCRLTPSLGASVLGMAVRNLFVVCVAAWLSTLPLAGLHFGELTLAAIPVGLLASPLVWLSLVSGAVLLLSCAVLPWFAYAVAPVCELATASLERLVSFAASLDPLQFVAPGMSCTWACTYYGLLVCLAAGVGRLSRSGSLALAGSWIVAAACSLLPFTGTGEIGVVDLDMGRGACTAVSGPEGPAFLLDCGSSTRRRVGARVVFPFLLEKGWGGVPVLVLSRADATHAGGVLDLADRIRVGQVLVPAGFGKSRYGREILDGLASRSVPVREIEEGLSFSRGGIEVRVRREGLLRLVIDAYACGGPGSRRITRSV